VLATLENVTVEVGGLPSEAVALGIDEDGLVIGQYGKLAWAGAELSVEAPSTDGCTIHIRTSTGADSRFFVPAKSLGSPYAARAFASWLESGAVHSGAFIRPMPTPV
jgi:hypothetical protein